MRDELTHAVEDYLKTIYDLSLTHGRASTTQIAEVLKIAPASVTGMIKRLSTTRPPLVEYIKHRGVILTPEGERVALEIIRHHRLLELFLYETLGYSWDEVDAEADRLEHVISEEFEARIAEVLGDPTHDPHGDPIPDKNLQMPSHAKLSLREMRPDQCGTIQRVRDNDPDLLRHLSEQGIVPQAHFVVTGYTLFDGNITIQVDEQAKVAVLGPRITRQIFVEQENG